MVFLLSLVFSSGVLLGQEAYEEALLRQFHKISSHQMYDWVAEFSAPEFNGRMAGSPGGIAAAEWLAGHLSEWGILPGAGNGSYYQWFDIGYNEFHELGNLCLHIPGEGEKRIEKCYTFPDNFFPGMNTGSGEITAEVVYVGYGITAPEHGYDDYEGVDVEGKIVLVDRDAPFKGTSKPEFEEWVQYCYHHYKLKNAVRHGARGFIYIGGNHANPNIAHDPDIIVAGIGPDALNDLFANSGVDHEQILEQINDRMKPHSFNTGNMVTMKANTTWHPDGRACNVIGFIEGSDPRLKNEVIIVGGHYDAVGNCSVLLPGALDNASGTIDILALAQAMSQSEIPLKRSVMFLFIGGEEVGLLGSHYYVAHPTFPKDQTICYINLDMVGNGTGFSLGSGKTYPGLQKFFEEANARYLHRPFRSSEERENYGRPRSDGEIFKRNGYRALGMGLTGWNKPVNYHWPSDQVDVTIDPEIMEDVTKLLFVALTEMARAEELDLP
jgi:hypothetical protein